MRYGGARAGPPWPGLTMAPTPQKLVVGPVVGFLGRLRFPYLFVVTLMILGVDLIVPDFIPMVDELLLGLMAVLFGSARRKDEEPGHEDVPELPEAD